MKIGEVSKIFYIPAETLRYIERQGLVHPTRSGDGQYRDYGIKAFGELFDYMTYRKIGLSVRDIAAFARTGSTDHLVQRMAQKEKQLEEEIRRAELLLSFLSAYRKKIETLPYNLGTFRLEKRPQYRYIICGYSEKGMERYADVSKLATAWRKEVPFVNLGFRIDEGQLMEEQWKTDWIFLTEEKYCRELSLPINESVQTQQEGLCLCTYAEYAESWQARDCCQPAVEHICSSDFRQNGAITVVYMGRGLRNGVPVQYVEVIIPVEQRKTLQ